jgi:hypothetical protein
MRPGSTNAQARNESLVAALVHDAVFAVAAEVGESNPGAFADYGHDVGLARVAPAPCCTNAFTSEAGTMNDW